MWKWLEFVLFLTVLCAVWGDDFDVQESPQETYGLGEADREGWRALNTFQDDDTVWIPRDLPQEPFEERVQKRRRLRKRKRRPTTESSIIDDLNSGEVLPERVPSGGRRKILPQRLEPDVDSWKEMDEDVVPKPNIRRRVTPDFQPSEELMEESDITPLDTGTRIEETVEKEEKQVFKSDENDAEGASKTDDKEFITTPKTIISDLKTVLKQSGTGSLSEILQQKNLSLSELLMGNQRAIYALTETPQEVTEASVDDQTSDTTKYKRLPPSIGLRKNINRNFEQEQDSFEELSTKKLLEAQRKRLSLLGHKDNRLFSTVTKYDVITEPTTERRIFVPSHPKYYTTQDFKPKFNIYDAPTTKIIQEVSTTTTSTTPKIEATSTLYSKPLLKNLPLTNAKINKLTSKRTFKVEKKDEEEEEKEEEEENYPIAFKFPTPIPINTQEVAEIKNKPEHLTDTRKEDEPVKMSIDLDLFTEKTTETPNYPSEVSKTTTELSGEKVVPATAKDEIMEIMKDPISRERLSRILESRNMTVKELVEQRERGSSQVHLADIFHNKTREPEPKEEPFVGTINTEYFNSFPLFGRQQKSRNFGAEPSYGHLPVVSASTTTPTVKTTEKTTTKPTFTVTSFPAIKIGTKNNKDQTQPFLGSKFESDLQPPIRQSDNKDKINKPLENLDETAQENYSQEELHRFENVDPTDSLASNEKLNDNNSIQEDEEVLINIPSGVKSAIFVSLAIICFSILVFLTILLVFKWTQRQSKRINYCNSLSTRVKSPIILQRRPTTTIKSFMNETLGRKKNYYQSNIQSTDELWECGRERIPSF